MERKIDLRGRTSESWRCVDCNVNTAPGHMTREQLEQAFAVDWGNKGAALVYDEHTEIYIVKSAIWKAAGMADFGGCLCIGCLEKRLGRMLTPKDVPRDHPLNNRSLPCTDRLRLRREGSLTPKAIPFEPWPK